MCKWRLAGDWRERERRDGGGIRVGLTLTDMNLQQVFQSHQVRHVKGQMTLGENYNY